LVRALLATALIIGIAGCDNEQATLEDNRVAGDERVSAEVMRKRIRDEARAVQFVLEPSYLAENGGRDHESSLRVQFSDPAMVSNVVDSFLAPRPVGAEAIPTEVQHSIELLDGNGDALSERRFTNEAELRANFNNKADADFMASLFRRAVNEALAKSKKQSEEE
jgi:hypothetical protein